jgi:hypothetical protein
MRSIILLGLLAVSLQAQQKPSPGTAPLGAWTPIPELPGMGRAVDIPATTARRQALLARLGRGTVLIPAAHERDLEVDYLQTTTSGSTTPSSTSPSSRPRTPGCS